MTTPTYILSIEGQEIPLPPELAQDDDKLRRVLTSIIPGAAHAQINRTVKENITTITVVKRAGSKGCSSPRVCLIQCSGGKNPVIALFEHLQTRDLSLLPAEQILILDQTIQQTLEAGQTQRAAIQAAQKRLQIASSQSAPGLVFGF